MDFQKELTSLKNENAQLKKDFSELKKLISEDNIKKLVRKEAGSAKRDFVTSKQVEGVISKSKDLKKTCDRVKELERMTIKRKDFDKFEKLVKDLQKENAFLKKLGKEVDGRTVIENNQLNFSRHLAKLEKKVQTLIKLS